jgi:hypothetical protein
MKRELTLAEMNIAEQIFNAVENQNNTSVCFKRTDKHCGECSNTIYSKDCKWWQDLKRKYRLV